MIISGFMEEFIISIKEVDDKTVVKLEFDDIFLDLLDAMLHAKEMKQALIDIFFSSSNKDNCMELFKKYGIEDIVL